MGRRRDNRLPIELPVSVSGFDLKGDPFVQNARTVEISRCGARLSGIHCVRGPGEILRVQYKNQRTRYRVIWMEKETGTLGLEALDASQVLFGDHLPAAGTDAQADTYSVPPSADGAAASKHGSERRESERREGERRRFKRHNCAGFATVREANKEFGVDGRVLDISMCGCYVEVMSPLRAGTPVHLDIKLSGLVLNLSAIVRVSQANMGMGVEFVDIPPGERAKLAQVMDELAGEPLPAASAAPPAPAEPTDPDPVGSIVLRWFSTHDQLTREEFQQLLRENKKA